MQSTNLHVNKYISVQQVPFGLFGFLSLLGLGWGWGKIWGA